MSTSVSRKAVLVGVTIVMAVVAALTLQPTKASATTGTILAGSTITVGGITTTLTANSAFDDAVSPWSAVGFFAPANGGTDAAILANDITFTPGPNGTFVMTGKVLIELWTPIGICIILVRTPTSVTLTLIGAMYNGSLNTYTYELEPCTVLLTAAVNNALLGPTPPLNPISIDFNIM